MKPSWIISALILCVVVSATAQWKSFSGSKGKSVTAIIREDGLNGTVIEFHVAGYYQNIIDIENKTYSMLSIPQAPFFLEKGYPELP